MRVFDTNSDWSQLFYRRMRELPERKTEFPPIFFETAHPGTRASCNAFPDGDLFGGGRWRQMAIVEEVKKRVEAATGFRRPTPREARAYDVFKGSVKEHVRALKMIPRVKKPKRDPVYGRDGPLLVEWGAKKSRA
jgi:hypothetical protein